MELNHDLIHHPAGYAEQMRQFVEALPWKAPRGDPRRISYLDFGLMALVVTLFWLLT